MSLRRHLNISMALSNRRLALRGIQFNSLRAISEGMVLSDFRITQAALFCNLCSFDAAETPQQSQITSQSNDGAIVAL